MAIAKGRFAVGVNRNIPEDLIIKIRILHEDEGVVQSKLAKRFNLSTATISNIVNYVNYADIGIPDVRERIAAYEKRHNLIPTQTPKRRLLVWKT